jgi:hypothetical protein
VFACSKPAGSALLPALPISRRERGWRTGISICSPRPAPWPTSPAIAGKPPGRPPALAVQLDLLSSVEPPEEAAEATQLAEPSEAENLIADYASTGLTLGRHPLSLLRAA